MTQIDVNAVMPPVEETTPVEPVVLEEPVVTPAPKPGERTDPAMLLESLKDEREKRRILEEEKAKLEKDLQAAKDAPGNTDEVFSEEGKVLKAQIDDLKGKLVATETKEKLQALQTIYPALKDKSTEFNDYRNDPMNAGMTLETAAKAYLAENDLLAKPIPARKGLEQGIGGDRVPQKQGISPEEADDLRKTNYRQYSKMVKSGEINF